MSHFSVLVVAANPEAALQPFHEFECTGINDEYIVDVDNTAEVQEHINANSLAEAIDYFGLKLVSDTSAADKNGSHKFGYAIVQDGRLIKAVHRTNPHRKWDWWVVGGRFRNKLILKDGSNSNQAPAGTIDWEAMIAREAHAAAQSHDAITGVVAGRDVTTWADTVKRIDAGEIKIDEARAMYNGQAIVKELIEKDAIDAWGGAEELSMVIGTERGEFIKRKSELNAATWGFLHNGEWSERGRMGWFGTSDADDSSVTDYASKFWASVRALPAEIQVTCVDCHI